MGHTHLAPVLECVINYYYYFYHGRLYFSLLLPLLHSSFTVGTTVVDEPNSYDTAWAHAACVCRWSLPGVWGFAAYITATNYLQAQKIVRPQVVTSAIVLALHAPINLLLIYTFGKQPCLHVHSTEKGHISLKSQIAPWESVCKSMTTARLHAWR